MESGARGYDAGMLYVPWLAWLVLAAIVAAQAVHGVALDSFWRPRFRKAENPRGFWAIIAIQTVILVGMAALWAWIIASEG